MFHKRSDVTAQPTPGTRDGVTRFLAELKRVNDRDNQQVRTEHLVVSSSDAYWLTEEETGNPSELGLLLHIPTRTTEFVLQRIPAGTATDLQRHIHESVHVVLSGSGWSEIGDQTVTWTQNDFVYTPPWIWHRHYANTEEDVKMIIVENSRILGALDADRRESLGNVSFAEYFRTPESDDN